MKREIIRVEPFSTYLERCKAPAAAVTRCGNLVFVSSLPPFHKETGEFITDGPIDYQTEVVLEQMKTCLEAAGSSLDRVLQCNVYCDAIERIGAVNQVYYRYFPDGLPARTYIGIPRWPAQFDIEIDCIACI